MLFLLRQKGTPATYQLQDICRTGISDADFPIIPVKAAVEAFASCDIATRLEPPDEGYRVYFGRKLSQPWPFEVFLCATRWRPRVHNHFVEEGRLLHFKFPLLPLGHDLLVPLSPLLLQWIWLTGAYFVFHVGTAKHRTVAESRNLTTFQSRESYRLVQL